MISTHKDSEQPISTYKYSSSSGVGVGDFYLHGTSQLSELRCMERKVFVTFKEKQFWEVKVPEEIGSDQIHLITAPGSQLFCSTEKGYMLKSDIEEIAVKTTVMSTSEDFKQDKTRIKFLLAGYYHVIAIKESNKIYVNVLSENQQYGKLEPGSSSSEPFSLVSTKHFITDGKTITHAVCGTYSTIVVLDRRYIYVAGRVERQLSDFTPYQVGTDYPVIRSISAGYGHMIVQTMSGEIYAMGMNNYGQTFSVTSTDKLEKVDSIPGLVNVSALRLSHLTTYTTSDTYFVKGYVGCGSVYGFKTLETYLFSKKIDNARELKMFGGFTSVVSFNDRTKELMAFGSGSNAPETPYDIFNQLRTQHAEKLDLIAYIDTHTVLDVACGSSLIAVSMDTVFRNNTLLITNLLKMKRYATHEMDHSSETVPFHDVLIIQ